MAIFLKYDIRKKYLITLKGAVWIGYTQSYLNPIILVKTIQLPAHYAYCTFDNVVPSFNSIFRITVSASLYLVVIPVQSGLIDINRCSKPVIETRMF